MHVAVDPGVVNEIVVGIAAASMPESTAATSGGVITTPERQIV
jgi:hypothetical protein